MAACRLEASDVVEELLRFGADPNATNDVSCFVHSTFVCKLDLLCKLGPQEDWTALMAAANNGRHDSVVKLLDYGADPDMKDNVGVVNDMQLFIQCF